MENKTIEQIVGRINSLLGTKSLTSAEELIDVAMDLQLLRYSEGIRRLALEIAANKKRKESRHFFVQRVCSSGYTWQLPLPLVRLLVRIRIGRVGFSVRRRWRARRLGDLGEARSDDLALDAP